MLGYGELNHLCDWEFCRAAEHTPATFENSPPSPRADWRFGTQGIIELPPDSRNYQNPHRPLMPKSVQSVMEIFILCLKRWLLGGLEIGEAGGR